MKAGKFNMVIGPQEVADKFNQQRVALNAASDAEAIRRAAYLVTELAPYFKDGLIGRKNGKEVEILIPV